MPFNPMWIPAAIQGISFLGRLFGLGEEEPEDPGVGGQYRPSRFLPQPRPNPYAPQSRPPQSGVSPDIMAYLRKYIR